MSDGGGGESSKEIESALKKRRKNDEFPQAIARIAVAQVCESVGFQGFQQSALDTFSDVACKYIREIGKTSNFYANLAGRTECNVFDIIQGLEDLSLSQGFLGASDRDHCLSGSVIKERKLTPSFLQSGETPPTDIIPPWLPKFPDSNTYIIIPPAITEETRMIPDRIQQEQRILEQPSSKLEQNLTRNESEFPNNPFLSVPLQPGEKEVSFVSIPSKLKEEDENEVQNHSSWGNHVSSLDIVPPNHAVNQNSGCDTEEGSRKVLLNNRPSVQMKFHIPKKPLDTTDTQHNEKGKAEVVSWFVNDEKEKITTEKLVKEQQPMDIEEHNGNDSVVN
ncbi:unnamed protein product [Lactuca saligna]|uniref:Bromodomain associated domain-containing protein n=1 Tax=Lactuca saligna TaxID=75948 RepID=A0AA35UQG3_LACSI|nr:unnamed protein product [Lactuca saligna]